jgi:hypothetical protein
MQWSEVLSSPSLKNLPFKIELNGVGKIEMTPTSDLHGLARVELIYDLGKNAVTKRLQIAASKPATACAKPTSHRSPQLSSKSSVQKRPIPLLHSISNSIGD